MESRQLMIQGGLIIRHNGHLTGSDLMNDSRTLFKNRALDDAKYIVSDFSQITWSTFEEFYGHEVGTYVREMRSIRITLRRPIRWAVVTADPQVEQMIGTVAAVAGSGIHLRVFANFYEALLWATSPGLFAEIAKYTARFPGNRDSSD